MTTPDRKAALEALNRLIGIDFDFVPFEADKFVREHYAALRAALSTPAPEVVTVEELARSLVIAFAVDATPKEIAENIYRNFPHGVIIKKG
jgi:hypothetical protein